MWPVGNYMFIYIFIFYILLVFSVFYLEKIVLGI